MGLGSRFCGRSPNATAGRDAHDVIFVQGGGTNTSYVRGLLSLRRAPDRSGGLTTIGRRFVSTKVVNLSQEKHRTKHPQQ